MDTKLTSRARLEVEQLDWPDYLPDPQERYDALRLVVAQRDHARLMWRYWRTRALFLLAALAALATWALAEGR